MGPGQIDHGLMDPGQMGPRTSESQDKWVPDKWVPEQMCTGQMGHWQMSTLIYFEQLNTFTIKYKIIMSFSQVQTRSLQRYADASIVEKE